MGGARLAGGSWCGSYGISVRHAARPGCLNTTITPVRVLQLRSASSGPSPSRPTCSAKCVLSLSPMGSPTLGGRAPPMVPGAQPAGEGDTGLGPYTVFW